MIYIVSGSRRTGTSMMMQAILAGNNTLDMLVSPDLEKLNIEVDGYKPNPNGLFELGPGSYWNAMFLRAIPDDCFMKIMYDGLPNLPSGEWKIIFMERDVNEINESTKRVDGNFGHHRQAPQNPEPGNPLPKSISDGKDGGFYTGLLPFCCLREYNQDDIDHVLGICEQRSDIHLTRVNHRDVIENPDATFNWLKDHAGWPIDPEKCVKVIDKSLYRCKA